MFAMSYGVGECGPDPVAPAMPRITAGNSGKPEATP